MTEETLSDKIYDSWEKFNGIPTKLLRADEVKEFIKFDTKVINDYHKGFISFEVMMRVRKKLAGEKLI